MSEKDYLKGGKYLKNGSFISSTLRRVSLTLCRLLRAIIVEYRQIMKVFISYCQDNGGLELAQTASLIYETDNRNKCWYFDRDKTAGADLNDDIRDNITGWCDCVLLICTNGTCNSDGQKNEIKWSLDYRISIIPVRVDEAPIPEILPTTLIWDSVNSANFIVDICRTIKNTKGYLARHGTLPKREIPKIDGKGTIL